MDTRKVLLHQLDETLAQVFAVYQNLPNPEELRCAAWTGKDILGHLVFWHESFARNLQDLVNDIQPTPLKGKYSELNQRCLAEMRTQTVADLTKRLEIAHRVIQENILNPKLVRIPYKTGSRAYTPAEHLEVVNRHFQEHLRSLSQADQTGN